MPINYTVEWVPFAGLTMGSRINGKFRVTYDGHEQDVPASMSIRTVTAFAAAKGIEDVSKQVQLDARVLAAWGKQQIEAALEAGADVPVTLTLRATDIQAQVILKQLGSAIDHAP